MKPVQLISPVDGRVYAERMPLTLAAAQDAVARARSAQAAWAARLQVSSSASPPKCAAVGADPAQSLSICLAAIPISTQG